MDTNQQPTQPSNQLGDMSTQPLEVKGGKNKQLVIVIIILAVLVAGGIGIYAYLQQRSQAVPLKVGVLLPFSGGSSAAGFGENKGILLAKQQLGATNIELVQEDSKCDAESAKEAMKRLVAQKVVAVIGEACSGASLGALPEADAGKTVLISPSASSPKLSIANDYFYRVVPPDQFQGQYAARLLYNKGIRKVALFYSNEDYGKGLSQEFKANFEELGGNITADVPYESGVIDLESQVNEVKASNPEAVYLLGIAAPTAVAALKQMQTAGLTVPIYSGDSFNDDVIPKNAGSAAEDFYVTSFPTGTKAFKQALKTQYQSEEQFYAAAQSYDAFWAIYQATQAGARTPQQVWEKLKTISFEGVSGMISFDENGEISNPDYQYELLQIKDGKFTTVEE